MENHNGVVAISVVNADVTSVDADVLVLKYAQAHYGLDRIVSEKLTRLGVEKNQFSPIPGISNLFHARALRIV